MDYMEQGSLFATDTDNGSTGTTRYVPALEVDFKVCGMPLTFTVDKAASVTVISETDYKKYLSSVPLESTSVKLKSYSENSIPVLGQIQVNVEYEGRVWYLPLVVVSGHRVALLGRDWLKHIKLNWHEMFNVHNIKPEVEQVIKNMNNELV